MHIIIIQITSYQHVTKKKRKKKNSGEGGKKKKKTIQVMSYSCLKKRLCVALKENTLSLPPIILYQEKNSD